MRQELEKPALVQREGIFFYIHTPDIGFIIIQATSYRSRDEN